MASCFFLVRSSVSLFCPSSDVLSDLEGCLTVATQRTALSFLAWSYSYLSALFFMSPLLELLVWPSSETWCCVTFLARFDWILADGEVVLGCHNEHWSARNLHRQTISSRPNSSLSPLNKRHAHCEESNLSDSERLRTQWLLKVSVFLLGRSAVLKLVMPITSPPFQQSLGVSSGSTVSVVFLLVAWLVGKGKRIGDSREEALAGVFLCSGRSGLG